VLIHLVRHGVTHANLARRFNGSRDDPLTAAQRSALRTIRFDHSRYDAIYCSPLRRAVETAACLGIVDAILETRIAERNLGVFEGLTPEECRARYPEAFSAFLAFDADFQIPGGESRAQNLARVVAWLRDCACHRRVLAVTHGGTVDFLYRLASGACVHGGREIFAGDNASVSMFEVSWPEVRLVDYSVPLDAWQGDEAI